MINATVSTFVGLYLLGYFIVVIVLPIVLEGARDKIYIWKHEKKMKKFNQIRQEVLLNPRVLTREEYRVVKSVDWHNQKKFLIQHLTEAGFNMYNASSPQGSHGKWNVYLEIWDLINTPLFRAMNEDKNS